MFHDLSFEKDGVTYYNYKWIIVTGIVLNSILTYLAEKLIIDKITVDIDIKKEAKIVDDFHKEMEKLQKVQLKSEYIDVV